MRRIWKFSIDNETIEDMIKAGRYTPCLCITFQDRSGKHTHNLSAGSDDVLDVYREGSGTYVLATNCHLEYLGLEVFEGAEKLGSIFLQGHQVKDVLGRESCAPFNVIKRLRDYIQ
tara:strand:+ start:1278 stop:1625 length:348 start_codon:yes stop_codon:yes gene_type:complete